MLLRGLPGSPVKVDNTARWRALMDLLRCEAEAPDIRAANLVEMESVLREMQTSLEAGDPPPREFFPTLAGPTTGIVIAAYLKSALENLGPVDIQAVIAALVYLLERTAREAGWTARQVAEMLAAAWDRGEAIGLRGRAD